MSVVAQLTSLNLNVGRALTRKLSMALVVGANGNAQKEASIGDILLTSFALCLLIALASAFAMAGSARWITLHVLRVQPSLQASTIAALYIGSAAVAATIINQLAVSIPQALQRFDLYAYVAIGVSVATVVGNCALAIAGFGVQSLILWAVAISVASTAVLWIKCRPSLPKVRWHLSFNRQIILSVVRFGGAVTVYGAIGSLISLAERVTVSRYCGTAAVTYYSVPMLIGTYIFGATAALTLVVFPLASQAVAMGASERLKRLYTRAFKYIVPLIALAVTLCVVEGNAVLAIWIGPGFAEHAKGLLGIDALSYGIIAFAIIPWQVIEGNGHPGWNAKLTLLWAAVAIPMMLILTPHIGIRGPAIARLLSVTSIFVYIYLVEKRVFGEVLWSFWRTIIPLVLGASALAGLSLYLVLRIHALGWLSVIAGSSIAAMVFVGVLCASGHWGISEISDVRRLIRSFEGDQRSDLPEEL
jgi:O-antigen/teichoic acid export membrane protein